MTPDPTVSRREIGTPTGWFAFAQCIVSSKRFQPGEGPSRGLLRDYDPSDLLRMEPFEALVGIQYHGEEGELK